MRPALIAITGGIGAGKSVVCRILRTLGYPVYDCDSRAKELMDGSREIKTAIAERISPAAIVGGAIDRATLSGIVFSDPAALETLNSIVHSAVRADLRIWVAAHDTSPVFVETAILYQSRLNEDVDAEWRVEAPEQLRVERILHRNGCTPEQARARIAAQPFTPAPGTRIPPVEHLLNDDLTPVLPQVLTSLSK